MATLDRPPLFSPKVDRPLPQTNTWTPPNLLSNTLLNKDRQFAGAGQWKSYDYPTPRERPYGIHLRTWTNSVNLNLLSKDKQFYAPGEWKSYDYPTPGERARSIQLLTWTNSVNLNLLNKDKQFYAPGQWKSYDYPNIKSRPSSIDLLTWLSPSLQTVPPSPENLPVFELPPKLTPPSPQLRDAIDTTPLTLLGKDQFFGAPGQGPNYLYPTPSERAYSNSLRTWTNIPYLPLLQPIFSSTTELAPKPTLSNPELRNWISTALNTLLQTVAPIFTSITELVPKSTAPNVQLRSWGQSTPLNLLSQDQFFGAPGQPPAYLYPTPTERPYPTQLRTWISQSNPSLIGNFPFVGSTFELTPKGITAHVQLRSWTPQVNEPLLALPPLSSIITALAPDNRPTSAQLRSWVNQVPLNLLGKDQFFGAAGQGPQILDWSFPRSVGRPIEIYVHVAIGQQNVTILVTGVLATGAIGNVTVSIPPPAGGDDQNKVRVGIVRSAYLSDNPSIGGMF